MNLTIYRLRLLTSSLKRFSIGSPSLNVPSNARKYMLISGKRVFVLGTIVPALGKCKAACITSVRRKTSFSSPRKSGAMTDFLCGSNELFAATTRGMSVSDVRFAAYGSKPIASNVLLAVGVRPSRTVCGSSCLNSWSMWCTDVRLGLGGMMSFQCLTTVGATWGW